jgi:hypothetical protein
VRTDMRTLCNQSNSCRRRSCMIRAHRRTQYHTDLCVCTSLHHSRVTHHSFWGMHIRIRAFDIESSRACEINPWVTYLYCNLALD